MNDKSDEELRVIDSDIHDYDIIFKGTREHEETVLRASTIIKGVLMALDLDFEEIICKRVTTHTFKVSKEGVTVDFVGVVPEYWYAEFGVKEKAIEVSMDDYRMRIPMLTVLRWFEEAKEEEDMK